MGYWEEKRRYESERERLSSLNQPTLRERERNLTFQEELTKLSNASGGLLLGIGFIAIIIFTPSSHNPQLALIAIVAGIIMICFGFRKIGKNRAIAWEKAVKRIPYVSERRKRRKKK